MATDSGLCLEQWNSSCQTAQIFNIGAVLRSNATEVAWLSFLTSYVKSAESEPRELVHANDPSSGGRRASLLVRITANVPVRGCVGPHASFRIPFKSCLEPSNSFNQFHILLTCFGSVLLSSGHVLYCKFRFFRFDFITNNYSESQTF